MKRQKSPYQQSMISKKKKELNRNLVSKGRLEVKRAGSCQVIKSEFQTSLIRTLSFPALK